MDDPFFKSYGLNKDGDVLVRLSLTHYFKVHASVLRRVSAYFRNVLDEKYAVNLAPKARSNGITTRYLIELVTTQPETQKVGRLQRMEIDTMGRFVSDNGHGRCTLAIENGKEPRPLVRHYLNMFGAFYNRPLKLNEETMTAILQDIFWLLEIAEYIGAVCLINKPIEIAFLNHGQTLLRSIAQAPSAWIDLAYRIKSEVLFKEALIHAVGKWNMIGDDEKRGMRANTLDLCLRKYKELREKCQQMERRVFSIYPASLQRQANDVNGRASYANDIMMWMALNFYRHWYGNMVLSGEGHDGKDGGYKFYVMLGNAGSAYLDRQALNSYFFGRFSMTKKGQAIIENHMLELKDLVKISILNTGILRVNSQLDPDHYPITWLTCTDMNGDEYPWLHISADDEKGDMEGAVLIRKPAPGDEDDDDYSDSFMDNEDS